MGERPGPAWVPRRIWYGPGQVAERGEPLAPQPGMAQLRHLHEYILGTLQLGGSPLGGHFIENLKGYFVQTPHFTGERMVTKEGKGISPKSHIMAKSEIGRPTKPF